MTKSLCESSLTDWTCLIVPLMLLKYVVLPAGFHLIYKTWTEKTVAPDDK